MKLPDEISETPYEVVAFRVHHFHIDEEDDDAHPGTVLVEIGARLPGTEAEIVVPLELTPEMVVGLADELVHQFRCLAYGIPDETEPDDA
jgi:hypothetical protein